MAKKMMDEASAHAPAKEEPMTTTRIACPVFYSIGVEQPIGPEAPLPPCPPIPRGAVVVIEGRAPIWRYGMALHRLHGSAAAAIAFFDPRLGAVVVATHSPLLAEGQVLDVGLPG